MKKIITIAFSISVLFILSACTANRDTDTNTNNNSNIINPNRTFVGNWVLKYETLENSSETLEIPIANKYLTINEDGTIVEDYSSLTGIDEGCSSEGRVEGEWEKVDEDTIKIDQTISTIVTQESILCPGQNKMGGAPKSILYFSYLEQNKWEVNLDFEGDTLTATLGEPSDDFPKVVQVYEKVEIKTSPQSLPQEN